MKIFSLIFGGIWTLLSSIFLIVFYTPIPGTIYTINGQSATYEEFTSLLAPKIAFGAFLFIGLVFLAIGIFLVIKDVLTKNIGEECFAKVKDIRHTNVVINGYPELKALLLVYIPSLNATKEIYERVGTDPEKYPIGSLVKVKFRKNDVVIISKADINELSIVEEEQLKMNEDLINGQNSISTIVNSDVINTAADVIEINGVKYKRIDQ